MTLQQRPQRKRRCYQQGYIYTMWPELTQELFTTNQALDSC